MRAGTRSRSYLRRDPRPTCRPPTGRSPRTEVGGLLGDVDGVVADALECPRDEHHQDAVLARIPVALELDGSTHHLAVELVDALIERLEQVPAPGIAAVQGVERERQHLARALAHLEECGVERLGMLREEPSGASAWRSSRTGCRCARGGGRCARPRAPAADRARRAPVAPAAARRCARSRCVCRRWRGRDRQPRARVLVALAQRQDDLVEAELDLLAHATDKPLDPLELLMEWQAHAFQRYPNRPVT